MLVHVGTKIEATFGCPDETGDVVDRQVIRLNVERLTEADFQQALARLCAERDRLVLVAGSALPAPEPEREFPVEASSERKRGSKRG